jgi:hypothetical protein
VTKRRDIADEARQRPEIMNGSERGGGNEHLPIRRLLMFVRRIKWLILLDELRPYARQYIYIYIYTDKTLLCHSWPSTCTIPTQAVLVNYALVAHTYINTRGRCHRRLPCTLRLGLVDGWVCPSSHCELLHVWGTMTKYVDYHSDGGNNILLYLGHRMLLSQGLLIQVDS